MTCGPRPAPSSPEFGEISRLLARLARHQELDAEVLHAEALARLTLRGTQSSGVLAHLEAASALAPSDLQIASDLLAVRLAHAVAGELGSRMSWEGSRQALRAVSESVRLASVAAEEPAVWFNYAVAFDTVGLPNTAREGWRRFLELEPHGEWADEARRQLASAVSEPAKALERPPTDLAGLEAWARTHPLAARRHLEHDLLALWAADPDSPDGTRALASGEKVARVTAELFGDSTLAETFGRLRSANPSARRSLAGALEEYFVGVGAYGEQRFTEALRAFTAARDGLADLPFRGWADYRIAASLYGLDRFEEAGALLVEMGVDPERQQALESRRIWLLALVEGSQGRLRESVALTERALAILSRHPDLPAVASMHVNLAAPLDQLSQDDRAWYHRLKGLQASARLADYRLRHVTLLDAATQLIALGEQEAALPFLAELGVNASAWNAVQNVPTALLEAALLHSSALSTAGRHAAAAEQLALAIDAAGKLADANRIERLSADIAVERAEVLLAMEPEQALEELDGALETYRRFGYRYPLVRVHRLRGAAAERLGMESIVADAYRAAVATHEEVLESLDEPEHRAGYLAHAEAAYDALLRHLAIKVSDAEEAFGVLESSRSIWSRDPGGPIGLRDLQSRLSPGAALVAYRVLEHDMLVWWVEAGDYELLVLPGGRATITEEVARHEAEMALARSPGGAGSATRSLFRRLLAPLEERLRGTRRLVILPDRLLKRVAFPALADSPGSAWSPLDSLDSMSLLSSAGLAMKHSTREPNAPILAIGDPAFDRGAFPFLDPLPAAAREAKEVAELYPGSVALVGDEAGSDAIHQQLRGRRALHYAGHAIYDSLDPERSGLILVPSHGDNGVLSIGEIEGLSVAGLDLVVLSACRTSGSDRSPSQDWADALLDAGVGGVVAARWDIEDEAARQFVVRFHQLRAAGLADPEALLSAQRDFRAAPPRVWAGFAYYGPIE